MALKKILIIDDEERLAKMMQLNLEATGSYQVLVETKAVKAFETAKRFVPDFIFVDMKMPDINGFEVMRAIKQDETLKAVPAVFLTAALSKKGPTGNPEKDSIMIGSYPYLLKPCSTQDLVDCIKKHLNHT